MLRSIEAFRRQTYPARELVIVHQGEPFGLPDSNIREISVPRERRTLADLRRLGMQAAEGDLVTTWEEDAFYGSTRLYSQVDRGWPNMLAQMVAVPSSGQAVVVSAAAELGGGFTQTCLVSRSGIRDDRTSGPRPLANAPLEYIRFARSGTIWPADCATQLPPPGRPLSSIEELKLRGIAWWEDHPTRSCRDPADVKGVLGNLPWMPLATANHLDSLIRQHGIRDILEIGHMHGVSTCYLAASGAHVTTVDMPYSECFMPRVEETLAACGLAATIIRRPSREALAQLAVEGRRWDLVFIDGGHNLADCWCDQLLADKLLGPGGWLVMDDIDHADWPGVKQVWQHLPEIYHKQPGPFGVGVARKRG